MNKVLLVLITVALAAAPLRGGIAMPAPATPEAAGHCAHMQHGMHDMDHVAVLQPSGAGQIHRGCDQGCAGDCCDGSCGTCAHASVALPAATPVAAGRYSGFLAVPVAYRVAGRTVHPPFRPPILFS